LQDVLEPKEAFSTMGCSASTQTSFEMGPRGDPIISTLSSPQDHFDWSSRPTTPDLEVEGEDVTPDPPTTEKKRGFRVGKRLRKLLTKRSKVKKPGIYLK
jgi:hypothetical protein